jgi:hypothetical protein
MSDDNEITERARDAYSAYLRQQPYPEYDLPEYMAGWLAGYRAKVIQEFAAAGGGGGGSLEEPPGRCYEPVTGEDLAALSALASIEEWKLFRRHPGTAGRHRGYLLCRALMQGAALHYVDGETGVKDWDVWSFYAPNGGRPFPVRWHGKTWYRQRRVDLFGRTLNVTALEHAAGAVQSWLSEGRTKSAAALAWKPAVLIYPPDRAGEVIWRGGIADAG